MLDEDQRREAFAALVAQLPAAMEPDLLANAIVSTAFFGALEAGWTVEALTGDLLSTMSRAGGSMGIVVSRFRSLAEHPPTAADKRREAKPKAPRWVPDPVNLLTPQTAHARVSVLRKATEGHFTPEGAEAAMREALRR